MKKLKILLIAILSVCIMAAFALFAAACNKGDENVTPSGELEKPEGGGGESGGGGSTTPGGGESSGGGSTTPGGGGESSGGGSTTPGGGGESSGGGSTTPGGGESSGGGSTTPGGGESGEGGGEISHTHEYGELVKEVPATCTTEGMQAHYYCEGCQTYFTEQKVETTEQALEIGMKNHEYSTKVEEVPATCTKEGMHAYYQCTECEKYFDENKEETTEDALKIDIDSTAHTYGELVEEVAATCTDKGMKAHYQCSECQSYFDDKQQPTTFENLQTNINPNGHKYGEDGICEYCKNKKIVYTVEEGRNSKTIIFGEYPQSEVAEEGLKVTLGLEASNGETPTADDAHGWTDYNYYIEGAVQSYMWYIDVDYGNARYRGVYFTSYRPSYNNNPSTEKNGYQDDNKYVTGTVYWFKFEPIRWRVLVEIDNTAYLMAESILDSQQFYHSVDERTIEDKTVYANNYAESDIRKWLNDSFYNTAFDRFAKNIIIQKEIDNSVQSNPPESWLHPDSTTYLCDNTNDNVTLLSLNDVTSYDCFTSNRSDHDHAKQLSGTAYAKSQGLFEYSDWCRDENSAAPHQVIGSKWWLRSPVPSDAAGARSIHWLGMLFSDSTRVCSSGVVPAVWITL